MTSAKPGPRGTSICPGGVSWTGPWSPPWSWVDMSETAVLVRRCRYLALTGSQLQVLRSVVEPRRGAVRLLPSLLRRPGGRSRPLRPAGPGRLRSLAPRLGAARLLRLASRPSGFHDVPRLSLPGLRCARQSPRPPGPGLSARPRRLYEPVSRPARPVPCRRRPGARPPGGPFSASLARASA